MSNEEQELRDSLIMYAGVLMGLRSRLGDIPVGSLQTRLDVKAVAMRMEELAGTMLDQVGADALVARHGINIGSYTGRSDVKSKSNANSEHK